jgi:tetratricopeptide (TPR) repeat protein
MLYLFTSDPIWKSIKDYNILDRPLSEWVQFKDLLQEKPRNAADTLIVNSKGITFPLDWMNFAPPYLLPEYLMLNEDTLAALVLFKVGEFDLAFSTVANNGALARELSLLRNFQVEGMMDPNAIGVETYQEFDDYRLMHNHAICRQYQSEGAYSFSETSYFFKEAIATAPNEEYSAFTSHHYALYLLDNHMLDEALEVLHSIDSKSISKDAFIALQMDKVHAWIPQLQPPYEESLLQQIKDTLWEAVLYFEKMRRQLDHAQALMEAAYIANISKSFAESLGYYSKAIDLFEQEGFEEFAFEGHLKKGQLLFTWAQNGNPQFYKAAMDAYQKAIRFFNKEDFPFVYAEIQEHLGIIYSEIPDEIKKKSIWAAVSSSSFQEALQIFSKSEYPYEYARVCNHYANALTKYPDAIHSDNFDKALYFYQEALEIRNAENYPLERTFTLMNFLEASWYANNGENEHNPDRLKDMENKVAEVLALSTDPQVLSDARLHADKLELLRELLMGEQNV